MSPAPATATVGDMLVVGSDWVSQVNIPEPNSSFAEHIADVSDMLTVSQKDLGGSNMNTDEIGSAIDRKGCRSATLAEHHAWAKAKWNGRDKVVALGSSWVGQGGASHVPCLCQFGGSEPRLQWRNPDGRWSEHYLFLVVRK